MAKIITAAALCIVLWSCGGDKVLVASIGGTKSKGDAFHWRQISGATAKIMSVNAAKTNVTFSGKGIFEFELTASMGVKKSVDTCKITVK